MPLSRETTGTSVPHRVIRPAEEADFPAFTRLGREAMLSVLDPEAAIEHRRLVVELDRSLGMFDGPELVGTTAAYSLTMTMPGGPRPVAGVTAVGVSPAHRRTGVVGALLRRQLRDIRELGRESVAALWATEGGIYGRFGYGAASGKGAVRLHRGEGALRPDVPQNPALRLRTGAAAEFTAEIAAVHERCAMRRVGEFRRDDRWWRFLMHDPAGARDGFSPRRCALVEDGGGPLGYALYRVKQQWDDFGNADGRLAVSEVAVSDPAARVLLWRHVLDRDLVATVDIESLPLDDALYHLLADRYRARTRVHDSLWIRLVDLPRAMAERSYAAPVDLVLEVRDTDCPWNQGRWRLTAGAGEARCDATGEAPDLRLDVSHLGSAYLGAARVGAMAAAGMVEEATEGAAARLDAAMGASVLPFTSVIF
ncbi:putative acetyltransferase [Murinocardiopsis flavida]|uniref:Putative acetyltransferase n=1 Tax=Murinocardiopsis flavida TaxID=645275 RepID=A0A2P8DUC8_9ACTN|nr:GNAT family N-acetyltransferase [Murinocardiopsis flavida]PSL00813.1 putative acetyltransferase [Murinocardiopsis flavida]